MSICVIILKFSTEITSSDQKEEMKIFEEIMKLVPSFKQVVMACTDHRRALLNLVRMVSFKFYYYYHYYIPNCLFRSFRMLHMVREMTTSRKLTHQSSIISSLTTPFCMITTNSQCLERRITPSVGGITRSSLPFFTLWLLMTTSILRKLRAFFKITCFTFSD